MIETPYEFEKDKEILEPIFYELIDKSNPERLRVIINIKQYYDLSSYKKSLYKIKKQFNK